METTRTTGSIEWTTRTTTSTIRQNVKCKCGLVSSRLLIETVKTTERSDRIGQVGQPQIKRMLENGRSEEPETCSCGREIHFRDVRGTLNAAKECSDKCMGSTGHTCECSCGGKNHGAAHASRDGRCHNMAAQDGFCRVHLRKQKRGEFLVSAWGIHSKQGLLITCDSRKSAEELLVPGETLVRVTARCIPAKEQPKVPV